MSVDTREVSSTTSVVPLGGALITEVVFNYPGFSQVLLIAVKQKDLPVLTVAVLISALVYMVATLAADLTIAIALVMFFVSLVTGSAAADYALAAFGGVGLTPREDRRAVDRWRRLRHRLGRG